MAIHWQIKFKALRSNIQYTVNIFDATYSGSSPIQLMAAKHPFSTTEDTSDDWFKPVRTQSGYIRFLDNGKDTQGNTLSATDDWKAIIPETAKSRPVTLTHIVGVTTVVDWQGYLQPQTFSGKMFEDTQTREYPIMCALSILESEEPTTNDEGMVNFAYILHQIFDKTGFTWTQVNFTGENVATSWITKRIYWNNFIEYDDDNNRVAKYNYFQILEELCKYWGWTCRTFGQKIYFVSPDDELYPDFISTTPEDIRDVGFGQEHSLVYHDFEWLRLNTNRDIYASTNNSVEMLRGIRKAEVRADFGLLKTIFSIPFSDIKKDLDKPPYPNYTSQGDHYQWLKTALPDQSVFHDLLVEYEEQQDIWEPCVFLLMQVYEGNLSYLHNFSWSCFLPFSGGQSVSSPPDQIVRLKAKSEYCFTGGIIYIKGGFTANAGGTFMCKFNIGNKWWTGTTWSNTETTFNIMFGNEQDMSQGGSGLPIRTFRQYDDPYPPYDGYGMAVPVDMAMVGKPTLYMSLIFLNDGTVVGDGIQALMSSLEIGFLRRSDIDVDEEKGSNVYTSRTNKVFKDEVSVQTIFACDDGNNFGTGLLLTENDTYCGSVAYDYSGSGGLEKPEEHLLGRIIAHGQSVKNKEVIELRSNLVPDINPGTWCNTNNMGGYPVSISREWDDDISKVIIIEP